MEKIRPVKIQNHQIGEGKPPFIVAEMSGNHNQSLNTSLKIVDAAADAGAHAVKLQTYTADTMTLDIRSEDFLITDINNPWKGNSLYDLYKKAYTPWEWHKKIFERCEQRGIICFSTAFDTSAVDFLESLGNPAYKIAAFENNDLPLLKKVAATGKPVIISTGMSSVSELQEAISTLKRCGCKEIILLKCTSAYPSPPESSNLATIPLLRQIFELNTGISDHTLGIGAALAGIALGACVVEKHFTLSRNDGGVDAGFSIEPQEMKQLVVEADSAWKAVGKIQLEITEEESSYKFYKRSLYVTEDLNEGDILSEKNVRVIRPGAGLAPKYLDIIIGKRINKAVKRGTPLSWEFIG